MGSTPLTSMAIGEWPAPVAMGPSAIVPVMNGSSETRPARAKRGEPRLAELLQAVAKKDRAAFDAFYNATTERVLNLVLRITRHIDIAEEVVGDVYLQVWRQADRFDPERGNALAWLTILCRSRALDTLRRNNAAPTSGAVPISEIPEPEATDFPQDLLIATEQKSAVHAALDKLDPNQRQLLALAYFRGYSHSELAQFTGMPLGTVKTQLRRTISKLKEFVSAPEHQEHEPA